MPWLSYRATPLQWCNLSPRELLQGRKIRTDLPQPKSSLIPKWTQTQHLKELHNKYKSNQSKYYNNQHRARSLPQLLDDTGVWVQTECPSTWNYCLPSNHALILYSVNSQRTVENKSYRFETQTWKRSGGGIKQYLKLYRNQ